MVSFLKIIMLLAIMAYLFTLSACSFPSPLPIAGVSHVQVLH